MPGIREFSICSVDESKGTVDSAGHLWFFVSLTSAEAHLN